ncbi:stage 0 sporulation family protein [Planctomycetota bacterium]
MPKFVVRYGAMRGIGILSARGSDAFLRGSRVIARTERGLEACEILCEATGTATSHLENPGHGQIFRRMTIDDENELVHMRAQARDEFAICQKHVDDLGLDMELVDLEHVFGGERIVVYYLAEERVDFRELVKRLAVEFQTRIEMRQIGVRDEAKLLADYGDCGKPVCCNTHLSSMPPVSMKMAKLQKATLDPTKISGRCGRLKCCLRYEYDTYVDLQKELPTIGSQIVTSQGRGKVLSQSILAQQLLVEMEDHRRILVNADEVLTVLSKGTAADVPRKRRSNRNKSNSPDKS